MSTENTAIPLRLRVYDGDTFTADLRIWHGQILEKQKCRIYGIDTPEKGWRAKTIAERELAAIATARAKELLKQKGVIVQCNDGLDKYGRWLVEIQLPDGSDYAQRMVEEGLARIYDGGTKSTEPWG